MISEKVNLNKDIYIDKDLHSYPKNTVKSKIIESIYNSSHNFQKAIKLLNISNLNEDKLTQIFVEQNDLLLRKMKLPIGVNTQYNDIHNKTIGKPDFYYYFLEEGKTHFPIFVVESKRLPAPSQNRELEYVKGVSTSGKPNGAIERFKLGLHGKGHNSCGILAFIEKGSFESWIIKINNWIEQSFKFDSQSELLKNEKKNNNYFYCTSKNYRSEDKVNLHHIWIKTI